MDLTDPDAYKTIRSEASATLRERGSKFHAWATPATGEQDVKQALLHARQTHPKATHHCYAFRLSEGEPAYRASDAREPKGSAGRPILQAIQSAGLFDVLVVVTRYYGGKKLGLPALSKAYRESAESVLASAAQVIRYRQSMLETFVPYALLNEFMNLLHRHDATIREHQAGESNRIVFSIRKSKLENLISGIGAHARLNTVKVRRAGR